MSNQENRIAIGEGDFVEVIYPPSLNQKEIDHLVELVREALHVGFIVMPAVEAHGTNGHLPGEGNAPRGVMPPGRACAVDLNGAVETGGDPSGIEMATGEDNRSVVILQDAGIGEPPDEARIKEANRRKEILETFQRLTSNRAGAPDGTREGACAPLSRAEAAKQVGTAYTSIWRWEKRFKEMGFNGLIPETERCGRKTAWEKIGLTLEEFEKIKAELRGMNLDLKSVTGTLRLYANSDRCPPELAAVILDPNRCSKHALPPSLRDAAKNNKALNSAHQGPRALSLGGAWTPRKMDVLSGDILVADDTTPIWGWWVPWEQSKEYPFGVKLLQGQFIPVMDVESQCVVTYVMIAREKSSYRASDIWHLFGHTFDQVGLPRLGFQLERGSWEANIIRGQEIDYRDGEVTMSRRIGGLRQLPTNVTDWHREKLQGVEFPKTLQTWTSYLPKTKTIEAAFNRMQTFEGTLWGCLGRDQMRAPFEKAKKLFQECQRGARDPREHFLSGPELAARINGILNYLNNEPMEGEVFRGVPIQNFEAAIRERPLFHVEPDKQWLYRRDWAAGTKQNPLRIISGWARVRLTDGQTGERYSLFYSNPEVFAKHEGEEIAVYYDREHFETPAQIILARTGEFLCEAEYHDRVGSFLGGDQTGHDMRKRWKNAVMSIYGTLVKHAPSRQVPEEILNRREQSRAEKLQGAEHRTPNIEHPTSNVGTMTVDRRPAAVELQGARSAGAATIEKQRNRLSQQAAIAARLRGLRGED